MFDKILELEEGNDLLQSELDKNTANDAVTDGNINSSISALDASLESLKLDLTKSLEGLTALQESLTESQTSLLNDVKAINSDILSINSSITTVSDDVKGLNSLSSNVSALESSLSGINTSISSLQSNISTVNSNITSLESTLPKIYLHSNGVTLVARSSAVTGQSYDFNGTLYLVVDDSTIAANKTASDLKSQRVRSGGILGIFKNQNLRIVLIP